MRRTAGSRAARDGGAAAQGVLVSVVLPTRNRLALLQRAVASALAQEGRELEVIVIDDGSTDGTAEWLAGVTDPRVRVFRQAVSAGVAAARNAGVAAAHGEWLAFLDDDDFWAPTYLAQQIDNAEATGAGIVAASAVIVDIEGRPTHLRWAPVHEPDPLRALLAENVFGGPSRVVVRTDAVRRAGGFDPALSVMADWDMWLSVARSEHVAYTLDLVVAVTNHVQNMQVEQVDEIAGEIGHIRAKHAATAASLRATVGGVNLYRWLAGQYRRAGRRRRAAATNIRLGVRYRSPRDLLRGIAIALGDRRLVGRRTEPVEYVPDWLTSADPARVHA